MITEICKRAAEQKNALVVASSEAKKKALLTAAGYLIDDTASILEANEKDLQNARESGMKEGLLDRLMLNESRIEAMAEGLRQIAELPDPIGITLESFERPNGLHISKVSVPIGVIGIIYEARPNVTADAFALCFQSGNVVILKGGSAALYSNQAIVASLQRALSDSGFPKDVLQLISETDREATKEFMKQSDYVDLLIPRGGAGLIRSVVENSTIPVIETGTGNCHIYVDKDADLQKAVKILFNAKTQRTGVCNAAESLVVHRAIASVFLPALWKAMSEYGVEVRADAEARSVVPEFREAKPEDFSTEYLALILSVKTVTRHPR